MAGFRHVHGLRAHSGGTVPDFNRIPYAPPDLCGAGGTEDIIHLPVILL